MAGKRSSKQSNDGKPVILSCRCDHAYQDGRYGRHMRVHNAAALAFGADSFRCTVCGNERGR